MASPTANKGYTYPAHGGAVNAWDTPLNENFETIDLNLGGHWRATVSSTIVGVTYYSSGASISSTAATITLSASLAANLNYEFSGTLTQDLQVVMPSEGAIYTFNNGLSGAFDLYVGTASSAGVTIPTGGTNVVACDADIIYKANSNQEPAQFDSYLGSPNGNVDGSVATTNGGLTDALWDVTNRQLYVPTASSSTNWAPQLARLVPEGILTGNNSTTNPRVVSDTTATTIYYTPYVGNWTLLSNGTILFPYQFSQMSLVLTGSQAANQIYDIFMYYNSGSPVIGTGPAWATPTAGSGARGTGAGTTQLARLQGILVNAVQVTLTNNASTYVCPANEGVYLGSIFIDTSAGRTSCYTSWGASRKWGIWNNYNRATIRLSCGISTASWSYASTTIRQANGDSTATFAVFSGLQETSASINWSQVIEGDSTNTLLGYVSIAQNSVTAFTNFAPQCNVNIGGTDVTETLSGSYVATPSLGVNNFNWVEKCSDARAITFYGTATNMSAVCSYEG